MNGRPTPFPLFMILTLALAGCGAASRQVAPQPPGASESAVANGGVQVLSVDAGADLRFAQTTLTAHPGSVRIVLQVTGGAAHDLTFTDGPQGGTSEVQSGAQSVTLTFARPGTYHFLCTIHPQMQGTLTIS